MPNRNPKSTAQIGGHPIHPMLIGFPIAFLLSALVCDILYVNTGNSAWAVAALWLVGSGVVAALAAAAFGFIDFLGEERVRELSDAWQHMVGNLIAVALAAISWSLRATQGAEAAIMPWGLTLSIAVALILGYTGWKGGELAYRHRVGVQETPSPAETQNAAARQRERT
jgi:uncharacterized membrane protein